MSNPVFSYDRGIATVSWGEPDFVEMTFDGIRGERGDVVAEMRVFGGVNGSRGQLRRTRINLCAPRSANEEARFLAGRMAELDWTGMLEFARWRVIDAHRLGRPAILLRDATEPPGGGLLLPPLLVRDDAVVIFGDGGTAKSYIGLALAATVHSRTPLVGWLKPLFPLRTAFLDWEWRPWPHRRRLRALWGDGELPDLLYVPCQAEGPLLHQVDRLRRILHEHRIEYVVIDSVALACAGKPEDAEVALAFFQALARLEVGACLLAHVNRVDARRRDAEQPFGSAFWHNSARITWNVQKTQDAGEAGLTVSLFNRKANDGPLHPPLGLQFEIGDRTVIRSVLVAPEAAQRDARRSSDRLHDRLAGFVAGATGATYEQAALELRTSAETIRSVVKRDASRTFRKWPDAEDGKTIRLGLQENPEHE